LIVAWIDVDGRPPGLRSGQAFADHDGAVAAECHFQGRLV
jgi:hypothetical protein